MKDPCTLIIGKVQFKHRGWCGLSLRGVNCSCAAKVVGVLNLFWCCLFFEKHYDGDSRRCFIHFMISLAPLTRHLPDNARYLGALFFSSYSVLFSAQWHRLETPCASVDLSTPIPSSTWRAMVEWIAPRLGNSKPSYQSDLEPHQAYSIRVELNLPPTPANVDLGMATVSGSLRSVSRSEMAPPVARPFAIPYRSPYLRSVWTFLSTPLLLTRIWNEDSVISIDLWNQWIDGPAEDPAGELEICLWTPEGARLQVTTAAVHFDVELSGLKYLAYHWFLTSATVFTGYLWLIGMILTLAIKLRWLPSTSMWGSPPDLFPSPSNTTLGKVQSLRSRPILPKSGFSAFVPRLSQLEGIVWSLWIRAAQAWSGPPAPIVPDPTRFDFQGSSSASEWNLEDDSYDENEEEDLATASSTTGSEGGGDEEEDDLALSSTTDNSSEDDLNDSLDQALDSSLASLLESDSDADTDVYTPSNSGKLRKRVVTNEALKAEPE